VPTTLGAVLAINLVHHQREADGVSRQLCMTMRESPQARALACARRSGAVDDGSAANGPGLCATQVIGISAFVAIQKIL
jgi:hypothetical protein